MSIPFPELAAIRLGYGLSPIMPPPADEAAVLADVAAAAAIPPAYTTEEARLFARRFADAAKQKHTEKMEGSPGDLAVKAVRADLSSHRSNFLRTRLAACAGAPVGFGERLIQFWSNHFTTAVRPVEHQPLVPAFIEQAIRPNIGGTFLQLFTAAETHPAMLIYLDQTQSKGDRSLAVQRSKRGGLNENLAREMLELHSLGTGAGYTQDDVRQLANLLAGLTYDSAKPDLQFEPRFAQPGAETVLGNSYGGTRRDGIEAIESAFKDIVNRPETARFIATKLAVHFVADDPDEGLVNDLADAWGQNGDLPALYAVLVRHPALAGGMRQKVRQPFDYLAAGLRALGLDSAAVNALPEKTARFYLNRFLNLMGQPWLSPPGPDGWAERGSDWINPQLLASRIDWAMNAPKSLAKPLPDPRAFLRDALGDSAATVLSQAVPRAESQRDGVGIVLASNDFNRR